MTPQKHSQWLQNLTQAEIDLAVEEHRRFAGESEHAAAARDTGHVIELQTARSNKR